MTKIAFIDHPYHKITSSSSFFTKFLKNQGYDIDLIYVSNIDTDLNMNVISKYEYFIVWQYDFIAPYLRKYEKKVLLIPMLDGSYGYNQIHWKLLREVNTINFSKKMHNLSLGYGLNSTYVQFFPNPDNFRLVKKSKESKIFFPERNSNYINISLLNKMIMFCDHFHKHNFQDPNTFRSNAKFLNTKKYTESETFSSSNEYFEFLNNFNIFISPRLAEGIGLTFLEAMASGMCVFANDQATMNEYIDNFQTGILFSYNSSSKIDFREVDFHSIGSQARSYIAKGYKNWEFSLKEVLPVLIEKFINNTTLNTKILKNIPVELLKDYAQVGTMEVTFALVNRVINNLYINEESLEESIPRWLKSNLKLPINYLIYKIWRSMYEF
jgi:glycosyltransferase involved in cell wall biosynthesis